MIECTYKIYGLRALVKSILRMCVDCRAGRPRFVPPGPIPKFRTQPGLAFQSIGIDFARFLWVKKDSGVGLEKRWLFIATCATTRAVHLELLPKATATGVWDAFRRMVSRKGQPSVVYSNNGKQLEKSSKVMKEFNRQLKNRTKEPLPEWLNPHIEWKFSSPYAP